MHRRTTRGRVRRRSGHSWLVAGIGAVAAAVAASGATRAENGPPPGAREIVDDGPAAAPAAPTIEFFDGFEDHPCGELLVHSSSWEGIGGIGGDDTWIAYGEGDDPPVFEGNQCVAVHAPSHMQEWVGHSFTGVTGGTWSVRVRQYLPLDHELAFIYLANEGQLDLQTMLEMASYTGRVYSHPEGNWLPLVTERWVLVEVEIDFDANWQRIYYDGSLLSEKPWAESGPLELRWLEFGGLDGDHYLDAVTIESDPQPCPIDLDGSGAVDMADLLVVLQNWGPCPTDKLTAYDGEEGDEFGNSVVLAGNRAFVGARHAAGVQADAGAVYVFRWDEGAWVFEEKLVAGDGRSGDQFGVKFAVSGDMLLVGARGQDNDFGTDAGAAYFFTWNGSEWEPGQTLYAYQGGSGDYFGFAVDLDGDIALVGAYRNDVFGRNAGAAYVFRRSGDWWWYEQTLSAHDPQDHDRFGHSVALDGECAFVGAHTEDARGTDAGAAYVYWWNGAEYVQTQKLFAPDGAAGDWFSHPIALEGDVTLIGAARNDHQGGDSGAAYAFRWDGTKWTYPQKLTAGSWSGAGDEFGAALALHGDGAIVGARLDDDQGGPDLGAAYIFRRNGVTWELKRKVTASDGAWYDEFGGAVALSDDHALVGARHAGAGAVYSVSLGCPGDVDRDGAVAFGDILEIIGAWGPCP